MRDDRHARVPPRPPSASTMCRQPGLQPGKQVVRARLVEQPVVVEASIEQIVRADVDRDERDLPRMRFQEGDRRVELRPGRVVALRVLPGDHRAGRLADAAHVPKAERRDQLLDAPPQIVDVPVRGLAPAGLVAGRQRVAEREVEERSPRRPRAPPGRHLAASRRGAPPPRPPTRASAWNTPPFRPFGAGSQRDDLRASVVSPPRTHKSRSCAPPCGRVEADMDQRLYRPADRYPLETTLMARRLLVLEGGSGGKTDQNSRCREERRWDRLMSSAGSVIAVVLLAMGAMAIFGGSFGRDDARDRLTPEKVFLAPLPAMSAQEQATNATSQGSSDDGPQTEAYAGTSRGVAGGQRRQDLSGNERRRSCRRGSPPTRLRSFKPRRTPCSRAGALVDHAERLVRGPSQTVVVWAGYVMHG